MSCFSFFSNNISSNNILFFFRRCISFSGNCGEINNTKCPLRGVNGQELEGLATGRAEVLQVCSGLVQPPAPPRKKGAKKKPKQPPPFTLSVTASITILDAPSVSSSDAPSPAEC